MVSSSAISPFKLENISWVISKFAPGVASAASIIFEIDPELLRQVAAGGVRRDEPKWRAAAPPAEAEAWWYFKSADWTAGLDPETMRPRWLSIADEDPVAVAWSDLAEVDGIQIAQTIGIERPTKNQHLLLKLHELQANHPIEDSVFHPRLPQGWRASRIGGLE